MILWIFNRRILRIYYKSHFDSDVIMCFRNMCFSTDHELIQSVTEPVLFHWHFEMWFRFGIVSVSLFTSRYMTSIFMDVSCVNSLWPSDAIRRQGTESTLAQVMACCLTAPSHYLHQCWLIISKVLWHSSEGIIMRRSEDTNQQNKIENYIIRIAFRSPRGQWVNKPFTCWIYLNICPKT